MRTPALSLLATSPAARWDDSHHRHHDDEHHGHDGNRHATTITMIDDGGTVVMFTDSPVVTNTLIDGRLGLLVSEAHLGQHALSADLPGRVRWPPTGQVLGNREREVGEPAAGKQAAKRRRGAGRLSHLTPPRLR